MVFYGYGSDSEGWKDERKVELADRLSEMVDWKKENHEISVKRTIEGNAPFVRMYTDGVYIRKITHLSEDQQDKHMEDADVIYKEVME